MRGFADNSDFRHWHDRAEQTRAQASRTNDLRYKHRLLRLADTYESLAQQIAQHSWKHTASSRFKLT
jgi:hypothetical protein